MTTAALTLGMTDYPLNIGVAERPGGFTWHVSTSGNDTTGDGSSTAPYQTFSKIAAVMSAGESVGLKRGDTWREELVLPASATVGAYGTGAKPIIKAADLKTSFVKTVGRTNVYEFTTTNTFSSRGINSWYVVMEDGGPLLEVADLATCDATAGSFVINGGTAGTDTVYFHPNGSTNPTSDGKVYEVVNRDYCIDGSAGGVHIRDVVCYYNGHDNGAIYGPAGSRSVVMDRCEAYWCRNHNVFVGVASNYPGYFRNGTVKYTWDNGTSANALVFYQQTGTDGVAYCQNTAFDNGSTNVEVVGTHQYCPAIYAHSSSAGIGALTVSSCTFTHYVVAVGASATTLTVADCDIRYARYGINSGANQTIWCLKNYFDGYGDQAIHALDQIDRCVAVNGTGVTVEYHGNVYRNQKATSGGAVWCAQNDGTIRCSKNTFAKMTGGGSQTSVFVSATSGVLLDQCEQNVFYNVPRPIQVGAGDPLDAPDVDNNVFFGATSWFFDTTTHVTLAAWQAATGADGSSIESDPSLAVSVDSWTGYADAAATAVNTLALEAGSQSYPPHVTNSTYVP